MVMEKVTKTYGKRALRSSHGRSDAALASLLSTSFNIMTRSLIKVMGNTELFFSIVYRTYFAKAIFWFIV